MLNGSVLHLVKVGLRRHGEFGVHSRNSYINFLFYTFDIVETISLHREDRYLMKDNEKTIGVRVGSE